MSTDWRTRALLELGFVLVALLLLRWAWTADRVWYEQHMLWSSCVYEQEQLAHFRMLRWAGAAVAVLLVAFVRPFAVRRLGALSPSAALRRVAPSLGAAIAAVLFVDAVLRLRHRPSIKYGLRNQMAALNDDYGWTHAPSKTTKVNYKGVKEVVYFMDANGNRVGAPDDATDYARPSILYAGESEALGLGLPYEEAYSTRIERRTGVPSVNMAVSAYGLDQSYMRVREQLPRFAHPLAVVTLVVQSAVLRTTDDRYAHLIPNADGALTPVPEPSRLYIDSPIRDLVQNKIGLHTDRHLQIARDVIAATAKAARARGAYPLFVFTDWKSACLPADDGGPPPLQHSLFDGLDVPFIRVDFDPTTWDDAIEHADARGHVQLADAIEHELRRVGVIAD